MYFTNYFLNRLTKIILASMLFCISLTINASNDSILAKPMPAWLTEFYAAVNWTGGGSTGINSWYDANNWNPGVPSANDVITINGASAHPQHNSGVFAIGNVGTGELNVTGGAQLEVFNGNLIMIGLGVGDTGKVTVKNTGSQWNTEHLIMGYDGNGELVIADGGKVYSVISIVGRVGTGKATITGNGSSWNASSYLRVAEFPGSTGTMLIADNGFVTSLGGGIGMGSGSSGTVTINNGSWSNTNAFIAGSTGTATLSIQNGGLFSTTSDFSVGQSSGGAGTTLITGNNSKLNIGGGLKLATNGTGILTVDNQGALVTQSGVIGGEIFGNNNQGNGTLTIQNSATWTSSTYIVVGGNGTSSGNFLVQSGGVVNSDVAVIGYLSGSTGQATINNAVWNASNFYVSYEGNGQLTISGGGKLNNTNGNIGDQAGITGNATVTGANSIWTNSSQLNVGKFGTGILTITNNGKVNSVGDFVGNNADSTGTVTVSNGGQWIDSGSEMVIGHSGTGTLNIQSGGQVSSVASKIGNISGSTGTVNLSNSGQFTTGGIIGGAGTKTVNVDGGIIKASQNNSAFIDGFYWSEFIIQSGGLTIDSNGYNIEITPTTSLTGTGGLTKEGTGTLTLNGAHNYSGTTLVKAGTLLLNGMIASGVEVQGGTFRLGSDQPPEMGFRGVQAFAAPGGRSVIAGNFMQQENSVYEVAIDGQGQADLMRVGGTATLNQAKVKVAKIAQVKPDAVYPIMYAQEGIVDTYKGLTADSVSLPLLDFNLDYDKQHVYLHLKRNAASFAELGITANQQALALGAENNSILSQAIVILPTVQAVQEAFDNLSGEVYASMTGILLDQSHYLADAVLNRLDDEAAQNKSQDNYWLQGFGNWGSSKSNDNAASLARQASGLLVGADSKNERGLRLGIIGGYSDTSVNVKARLSQAQSDSYHLGLYGSRQMQQLRLSAGGAYSWHAIGSYRTIQFQGLNEQVKANYHAYGLQGYGEADYRLLNNRRGQLEPFIQAAYVRMNTGRFIEQAAVTSLAGERTSQVLTYSTVGTRLASKLIQTAGMNWQSRAMLGWRHAYSGINPIELFRFAGNEETSFTVTGVPLAKDGLMVDAGIIATSTSKPWQVTLAYNSQLAKQVKDQSIRGVVSWHLE